MQLRTVTTRNGRHFTISTVELPQESRDLDRLLGMLATTDRPASAALRSGLPFETMVFPSDADGRVTSWTELDAQRYGTGAEANEGHTAMVAKWSQPEAA
ncbi:MAG TPA: hypothetical protein VLV48_01515 [Thermoanaerobaculia bacterium]|nr:hypothetical protein [Thermoanaerobaculia bacterium]